jgi:uncharacterized repeat protein (TIGR02543 family)
MQASSRVPVSLKNKSLLERSKFMKKIIFIISALMMSFAMMIIASPVAYASTIEQVQLLPANTPIQIKAGDTLTFTRVNEYYNNVTYTEYFRNNYSSTDVWGFSSTGTGHSVRYNGTSFRLEGGTWQSHAFSEPYSDEWISWTYTGDVGTLTFLQDWPVVIEHLIASTATTSPKMSWSNSTSISKYAVLNLQVEEVVNHTVSFDSDGGSSVAAQTVADGSTATEPTAPTKAGYDFIEWRTVGTELAYDFDAAVTSDVNLIAIWGPTTPPAAETYSVVFNANGGSSVATQIVLEGNLASVPPQPTRPGYDFVGWVTDTEAETLYNFSTPVTSDITVYALWLDNGTQVYTITFITDGGTQVNAIEIEDGEVAVAPTAPLKSGYSFVNWVITGTETVFDFSSAITSDLSLTAVWETSEVTFILITFNSNGGSFVASQVLYDDDLPVEPTDPTRAGYTFAGWYKDIALTQAFSFVGDAVTEDLSLYAKWTPVSGGGDPITPDESTSSSVWLYVGLGVLVLAVAAGSELKKKGKKR